MYYARHTWATLCVRELKADNYIVGHALGHAWATKNITETYIDFDMDRVDELQQKLIDLINK